MRSPGWKSAAGYEYDENFHRAELRKSSFAHALLQVVEIVRKNISRGGGREAAEACAEVISASAERWRQFEGAYRDDISCIVLRLPCFHNITDGFMATSEGLVGNVRDVGQI